MLCRGSWELHPTWDAHFPCLLRSHVLPTCSLLATSFVHVVHVPILLFTVCTAMTQFHGFDSLDSELLSGRSWVQIVLFALGHLAVESTLSTPLMNEKLKWLH